MIENIFSASADNEHYKGRRSRRGMVEKTDFIGKLSRSNRQLATATIFKVLEGPQHCEICCKSPIPNMTTAVNDWIQIAHPLIEERTDHELSKDF